MDEVLEKWFKCDYDFFAKNVASCIPDNIIGAYSILNIIENSLILFIDYCYNNNIKICEQDFAQIGSSYSNGKCFRIRPYPEIIIELNIYKYNDKIDGLVLEGQRVENGKIKLSHGESLSNKVITEDVVQARVKEVFRSAILHIMRDVNLDAYFIVQGINVRNYII